MIYADPDPQPSGTTGTVPKVGPLIKSCKTKYGIGTMPHAPNTFSSQYCGSGSCHIRSILVASDPDPVQLTVKLKQTFFQKISLHFPKYLKILCTAPTYDPGEKEKTI
jgi:hypothetical protein